MAALHPRTAAKRRPSRKVSPKPSFSVVIPCRNGELTLASCLDAVYQSIKASRKKAEVIVVLNDCSDGSKNIVKRYPEAIQLRSARGRSIARNKGWKHAAGQLVFFIDCDVIVHRSFFSEMTALMSKHRALAAATAPIIPTCPESELLSEYLRFHSELETKGTHVSLFRTSRLCPLLDTAACVVRSKHLKELGGFDESLARHEDYDFSHRLILARLTLGWTSKTQVTKLSNSPDWASTLNRCFDCGYHLQLLYQKWKPEQSRNEALRIVLSSFQSDLRIAAIAKKKLGSKAYALALLSAFRTRMGSILSILESERDARRS